MNPSRSAEIFRLVVLFFLFGLVGQASAQLLCHAEVDATTAVQGATIVLTVTAEGEVSGSVDFQLPEILQTMVSGTSYSRSQSYANGQSSISIAKTFYITAQSVGDLTLGPVVVSDGKNFCKTDPITLKIISVAAPVWGTRRL